MNYLFRKILINQVTKILIVLFITISNLLFSQSESKNGEIVNSLPKLMDCSFLTSYTYTAFDLPESLAYKKITKFDSKHLRSPKTVIESYLNALSGDWQSKLYGVDRNKLNEDLISYRLSEDFKKEYLIEFHVEMSFQFEGNDYHSYLVKYNNVKGRTILMPLVCKRVNGRWYMCLDKKVLEFSGFLYLKPRVFHSLMTRANDLNLKETSLLREYQYGKAFRVDKGFSILAIASQFKKNKITSILIDSKKLPFSKKVSYSEGDTKVIGMARMWSPKNVKVYKFNEYELFDAFIDSSITMSSPEEALSSWVFEKGLEDKRKNILAKNPDEILKKYPLDDHQLNDGRIKFDYKIVFSSKEKVYSIIYFEEFKSYLDEKGRPREEFIGYKRLLLTWDNGWGIDFSPSFFVKKTVWFFDHCSYEFLEKTNEEYSDLENSFMRRIHFLDSELELNINNICNSYSTNYSRSPSTLTRRKAIKNKHENVFGNWW